MKLRFVMAYGSYVKGAEIDPPAMLAGQLLALRFLGRPVVERIVEPAAAAAPAAAPPAAAESTPAEPPAARPQQPPPQRRGHRER